MALNERKGTSRDGAASPGEGTTGGDDVDARLSDEPERRSLSRMWTRRITIAAKTVFRHFKTHSGVGMVCAVAYFDPGNWGVDLKAGSQYGYRLLFVVLLAGIFAVFFQVLASRLGCVTGLDLASHCRLLLKHSSRSRWLALYPLYLLSEIAIVATDLAELLGSAIALCLLFPKLQLWHGVLITSIDVLALLAMGDPLAGTPVKWFEWVISGLVLSVLVCMCVILGRVDVNWGDTFIGFLPSRYIIPDGALYTSVAIMGATIMPHSLFLGSSLATQDRLQSGDSDRSIPAQLSLSRSFARLRSAITSLPTITRNALVNAFRAPPPIPGTHASRHSDRENNSLSFVKAHLYHGIVDVAMSLICFAVLINSSILIISSAVFFHKEETKSPPRPAGLFDAYDLIYHTVGKVPATLFAVALLAAGQSASIVATVAGQAVSEGFLHWRTSPVLRRLITRLISLVPSMTVALVMGRDGIDVLLIASQVVLAVVLPFVMVPLLWLTSKKEVMRVRRAELKDEYSPPQSIPAVEDLRSSSSEKVDEQIALGVLSQTSVGSGEELETIAEEGLGEAHYALPNEIPLEPESQLSSSDRYVYFHNGPLGIIIGGAICLLVMTANVYMIITLGMGKGEG